MTGSLCIQLKTKKISRKVGKPVDTTKPINRMLQTGRGNSKICLCGEMPLCQSDLLGWGFQRVDVQDSFFSSQWYPILFLRMWSKLHKKANISWPPTAQRFFAAHLRTAFFIKAIFFYNWCGVRGVGYGFPWSCFMPRLVKKAKTWKKGKGSKFSYFPYFKA